MNKTDSAIGNNVVEIVHLLDEIVKAFDDAYSRPKEQIELYARFLELHRTYRVRLAGRFIVIEGGRGEKKLFRRHHQKMSLNRQRHLKTVRLVSSSEAPLPID
jgi:hypothetical protein